jgi:hypothetical protein
MVEFRNGHIEVGAQAVLQAAQDLPLVFERPRVGDVNFQGEKANRHFRSTISTETDEQPAAT